MQGRSGERRHPAAHLGCGCCELALLQDLEEREASRGLK